MSLVEEGADSAGELLRSGVFKRNVPEPQDFILKLIAGVYPPEPGSATFSVHLNWRPIEPAYAPMLGDVIADHVMGAFKKAGFTVECNSGLRPQDVETGHEEDRVLLFRVTSHEPEEMVPGTEAAKAFSAAATALEKAVERTHSRDLANDTTKDLTRDWERA